MSATSNNPITRRVSILQDQWAGFTQNPAARLLRWQIDDDELAMIEAFFAMEADADAAESSDLLLVADVPFVDPDRHGVDLRKWLCASYEAEKKELAEAGVKTGWVCPTIRSGQTDIQVWIEALTSFHKAHGGEAEEIVGIWLRPPSVIDITTYIPWLQRLIHAAPLSVRFIVTDEHFRDELNTLARHEPQRMHNALANLDMPAALEEIASDPSIPPGPGADFRLLFARVGKAAKKGNHAEAEALGAQAVTLAQGQGWHLLACAAQCLLASVSLQAQNSIEGAKRFFAAEESAKKGEAAGLPEAKTMRLQSRMAGASALLSAGDFRSAGKVYQSCVPLAKAAVNPRSELDAWRLTSYCHEQNKEWQPAWDTGLEGFKVAKGMDVETRKTSTVRFLCELLLRLTNQTSLSSNKSPIEKHIVALLGPNWRKDG
jgi:hypothetical protein